MKWEFVDGYDYYVSQDGKHRMTAEEMAKYVNALEYVKSQSRPYYRSPMGFYEKIMSWWHNQVKRCKQKGVSE